MHVRRGTKRRFCVFQGPRRGLGPVPTEIRATARRVLPLSRRMIAAATIAPAERAALLGGWQHIPERHHGEDGEMNVGTNGVVLRIYEMAKATPATRRAIRF